MSSIKPTPVPLTDRCRTQPFVVVGCIIEYNKKYLMVQEGQGSPKGTWNHPAGWLDMFEPLAEGALREAKEETGITDLKLSGFIGVYTLLTPRKGEPNHALKFIFAAKANTQETNIDGHEIVGAKWLSLEEIKILDNLRDADIPQIIQDYEQRGLLPIDQVERFTNAL